MTEKEGGGGSEDILDKMSELFAEIDDLCDGLDHDLVDIKDSLKEKREEASNSAPDDSQGKVKSSGSFEGIGGGRPVGPQRLSFQRRSFRSAPRKKRGIVPRTPEDKPKEKPEDKRDEQPGPVVESQGATVMVSPEDSKAYVTSSEAPEPAEQPDTESGQTVAMTPEELETELAELEEEAESEELGELEAPDDQLAPGDIEATLIESPTQVGASTQLMGAHAAPDSGLFDKPPKSEAPVEPRDESEVAPSEIESVGVEGAEEQVDESPPESPPAEEPEKAPNRSEAAPERAPPKRLDQEMAELITTVSKPVKDAPEESAPAEESGRPSVMDADMIALLQKSKKKQVEEKPAPQLSPTDLTVHPSALEEAFKALSAVEGAELVCVFTHETKLTLRHIRGVAPDDLSKLRPLFDRTLEEQNLQLVLDTFKERGFEEALGFFRSGVSVPVLAQGRLVGILFVGSSKPGVLAYGAAKKLEMMAESLASRFKRVTPEQRKSGSLVQAVKLPESNPVKLLMGGVLLVGLALIWTLSGTYYGATTRTPRPTPTENEQILKIEKVGPEVVSITLLREVNFRRWAEAYQMLSPQLQEAVSQEQFTELFAKWVEDGGNRWDLGSRRPMVLDPGENFTTVSIEPGPQTKGGKPWKWVFVKEKTGWKLADMKGPLTFTSKN